MRALRYVALVIVNNRLHVGLMPAMVTLFWSQALALPLPLEYYAMITIQTLGAYWWNIVTDRVEDEVNYPAEGRFIHPARKSARVLIHACFVASFLLALRSGWRFVAFGAVLNLLGTAYGLRFPLGGGRGFRIKSIPVLKNAYSSAFWSVALVASQYVYLHRPIERQAWLAVVASFVLAFFVELLWDVRDVAGDRLAGLRTLPLLLGEGRCRWLLHGLNVTSTLLVVGGVLSGLLPLPYWAFLVHTLGVPLFVEWYARLERRQWASHLYLLFAASVIILVVALGDPAETVLPGLLGGAP